jgi:hypothetical protein
MTDFGELEVVIDIEKTTVKEKKRKRMVFGNRTSEFASRSRGEKQQHYSNRFDIAMLAGDVAHAEYLCQNRFSPRARFPLVC